MSDKSVSPVAAPLVTVVIPSYNAAATIDETLRSVRAQRHRNLEILVVDDGSADATAEIALRHQQEDGRVRVLKQKNGGVAKARNHGIAEAKGAFVAPVDADDLWEDGKIERQLRVLLDGGPKMALVYNWYAAIDENSIITSVSSTAAPEGMVFEEMLRSNFIGNGSTPLMRRDVVLACGGYDSGLHAQGAQGCEDLKLYLAIAEHHHFGVVPDFLTGYRFTAGNMSSNGPRMIRSYELVTRPIAARYDALRPVIDEATFYTLSWYAKNARRARNWSQAKELYGKMVMRYPLRTLRHVIVEGLWTKAARQFRRVRRKLVGDRPATGAAAAIRLPEIGRRFPIGRLEAGAATDGGAGERTAVRDLS